MKSLIINCFDTFDERVNLVNQSFVKMNIETVIIKSDFSHRYKKKIISRDNSVYIPTPQYIKNLSLKRLLSHIIFSHRAYKFISKQSFDIIYVVVPPNYLLNRIARLKSSKNFTLIADIVDMWPESFPSLKIFFSPLFNIWKNYRNNSLRRVDLLITECQMYFDKLKNIPFSGKHKTLYFAKENDYSEKPLAKTISNNIGFLYLGSINNIINIDLIVNLVAAVKKYMSVSIDIIGDGEKREELLEKLASNNIKTNFHGIIFDDEKIKEIAEKSMFGLNLMKEDLNVGLTMKSIHYFQLGLPLINNIKYDTHDIVSERNCGINIHSNSNLDILAYDIFNLQAKQIQIMSENSRIVFETFLTKEIFENNFIEFFQRKSDNEQ
jgi:hypothetical protein